MTNGIKSVSRYEPSTLAFNPIDRTGARLYDPQSSFTTVAAPAADQSAQDTSGSSQISLFINADESSDHIVRSLSIALETVELEHDEYCAQALRLAIAARLTGPQAQGEDCAGDADFNGRPIQALQKWRLKRVVEYVDTNLSNKVSLPSLAAVAGLSRMHFASQFRVATGLRPHEFVLSQRICRSKELLGNSQMPIVEIAFAVGFQTQAHFTTVFKRFAGSTPRQWRTENQILAPRRTRKDPRAEMRTSPLATEILSQMEN
jgi:AraC family transcriptional regulator